MCGVALIYRFACSIIPLCLSVVIGRTAWRRCGRGSLLCLLRAYMFFAEPFTFMTNVRDVTVREERRRRDSLLVLLLLPTC
jgi:hypothetical protein